MKKVWKRLALILTIFVFLLAGCGKEERPEPRAKLEEALQALQAKELDRFGQILGHEEDPYEVFFEDAKKGMGDINVTEEVLDEFVETIIIKLFDFQYEILEETVDGDTANIKLNITAFDADAFLAEMEEVKMYDKLYEENKEEFQGLNEKETMSLLITKFTDIMKEAKHSKSSEIDLTMKYSEEDNSWHLDMPSYELIADTIFGDLVVDEE